MAEEQDTKIETIEIDGNKFTVTPQFKEQFDKHVGKIKDENKSLSQKLDEMKNNIGGDKDKSKSASPDKSRNSGGDDDTGGEGISFDDLMDDPEQALNKFLKKHGYQSSDPEKIKQELRGERALEKYWDSFYTEHKVFDREKHHDIVELVAKRIYGDIKDLSPKESRKKIAESVADKLGRELKDMQPEKKDKLIEHPGVIFESGDAMLDSGEKTDKNKGDNLTMSDMVKQRRAKRREARTQARS